LADALAVATPDYTGAELAAVVKMAARKTAREITREALADAVAAVRPLARIDADRVAEIRQRSRATMRLANDTDTPAAAVAATPDTPAAAVAVGRVRRISAASA
jgi:SpoVK/Ycf46/Vps4 family AAA+-type ATPase